VRSAPGERRAAPASIVAAAIAAKSARLAASAGHAPSAEISDIGARLARALHHGICAVPMTEPAMNAASVISMRVLPPPTV